MVHREEAEHRWQEGRTKVGRVRSERGRATPSPDLDSEGK